MTNQELNEELLEAIHDRPMTARALARKFRLTEEYIARRLGILIKMHPGWIAEGRRPAYPGSVGAPPKTYWLARTKKAA